MRPNGFVAAVIEAVNSGSDNWEANYYHRNKWSPAAREVYMHSRLVALGPEWAELQRCVLMVQHKIPFNALYRAD